MKKVTRIMVMLICLSLPVLCGTTFNETKIVPSTGNPQDAFGRTVDIHGNFAAVEVPFSDPAKVMIYQRGQNGTWFQKAQITSPPGQTGFGYALSISQTHLAIATTSGLVLIYQNTNNGNSWVYQQTLVFSSNPPAILLPSLAIDGGRLLVGDAMWGDPNAGNGSGRVYCYENQGGYFVFETILEPAGLAPSDQFGTSVGLSGNQAVIGTPGDNFAKGAAYFYQHDGNNWNMLQKYTAPDGLGGNRFGFGVALSNGSGRAVISATYDDQLATDAGAAYIAQYNGTNWQHETKLFATDGQAHDWFGGYVDIHEDKVVVGATGHDHNGSSSGAAYLFSYSGWTWQGSELLASDGAPSDWFGHVAIHGSTIISGAPGDDPFGSGSGAAYVFTESVEFIDFNIDLHPWPYIYIYTGCGFLNLGETAVFEINDGSPCSRPAGLKVDIAQEPEHGQAFLDGNQLIYESDGRHLGFDTFYLVVRDEAGVENHVQVQVLIMEEGRR